MISLVYFAWVREQVGADEEQRNLPAGTGTVEALITHLETLSPAYGRAFEDRSVIRAAVNMKAVPLDHPIKDGDEIAFFPPMTGGSDVTITVGPDPIDEAAELKAFPRHAETGAVVSFTGTVRSTADAPLETLTLEHYPGMTEQALADIAAKAQARWPLTGLRIAHRVGPMTPTETIVLVIAASAHRDAAFEAARYVMDVLKTDAPFWKKERGAQGEKWVEARASDDTARNGWDG